MDTTIPREVLESMAAERRQSEQAMRNADRLRRWRIRWWLRHGAWPDESARLAQMVAGWPVRNRGGWPQYPSETLADVVSLADRRRNHNHRP